MNFYYLLHFPRIYVRRRHKFTSYIQQLDVLNATAVDSALFRYNLAVLTTALLREFSEAELLNAEFLAKFGVLFKRSLALLPVASFIASQSDLLSLKFAYMGLLQHAVAHYTSSQYCEEFAVNVLASDPLCFDYVDAQLFNIRSTKIAYLCVENDRFFQETNLALKDMHDDYALAALQIRLERGENVTPLSFSVLLALNSEKAYYMLINEQIELPQNAERELVKRYMLTQSAQIRLQIAQVMLLRCRKTVKPKHVIQMLDGVRNQELLSLLLRLLVGTVETAELEEIRPIVGKIEWIYAHTTDEDLELFQFLVATLAEKVPEECQRLESSLETLQAQGCQVSDALDAIRDAAAETSLKP